MLGTSLASVWVTQIRKPGKANYSQNPNTVKV